MTKNISHKIGFPSRPRSFLIVIFDERVVIYYLLLFSFVRLSPNLNSADPTSMVVSFLGLVFAALLAAVQAQPRCALPGEEYKFCGPSCEPTCLTRFPLCTPKCVSGCFCISTLLRSPRGECIPPAWCPGAPTPFPLPRKKLRYFYLLA